ncbi:hypothetical protein GQ55_6G206800 [Panicum hallii var. hallii]|uniref:Uncharacterized protein n=1 Tax=Panicum hallii var. hallii TaxID=1504633 RepID=A0A2T7D7W4_9POAL|nr:hypothetical protein GQ55_6G206800 [Panicum hallii var. hallii]
MEGPSQGCRSRSELRLAAAAWGRGKPHPQRTAACNACSWRRRRGPRRLQRPMYAVRTIGSIGGAGLEGAAASGGAGRVWRRHVGFAARSAPAACGIGGAGPGRAAASGACGGAGHGRAASSDARSVGPRRVAPAAYGPLGSRSERWWRLRLQCAAGGA